jgi:ATP-dependent helicase/nuclease subunit B
VLREQPKAFLSDQGALLLFKKTVNKQQNNLVYYKRAAKSLSFVKEMFNVAMLFRSSGISPQALGAAAPSLYKSTIGKAKDIALLLSSYEEELKNFDDAESRLTRLVELVKTSSYFKGSHIYIGGFHRFSAPEYKVIEQLVKHATSVNIALATTSKAQNKDVYPTIPLNKIKEIAAALNIKEDVVLRADEALVEPFKTLNKTLFTYSGGGENKSGAINVYLDKTVYDEFNGIAKHIKKLVNDEGLRYKDFALVNLYEGLETVASSIFNKHGIPVFTDTKYKLIDTYLAKFLIALLDAGAYNLRRDKALQLIKSPLFGLTFEQQAELENHILKHNINYINIKTFHFSLFTFQLPPLAATGSDYINFLKQTLSNDGLNASFENLLGAIEDEEFLKLSNERAAESINGLLQEFELVLGNETLSVAEFSDLFKSLLEANEISLIPQFIDSVFMGNLSESRYNNIKVMFVMGAVQGKFPNAYNYCPILSQGDYESLKAAGLNVYPSPKDLMQEEEFLILQLVTKPALKLFLGGAASLPNGEALKPSPVVKEIVDIFKLNIKPLNDARIKKTPNNLNSGLQKTTVFPPPSLYFKRGEGGEFYTSATALEGYFRCPYLFYLRHGLKLTERETGEVKPLDTGKILHKALEIYFKAMLFKFKTTGENERKKIAADAAEKAVNEILGVSHDNVLLNNQKRNVQREFLRLAEELTAQVLKSGYEPTFVEKSFGFENDAPAVEFEANGERFLIRGRLDRVDTKEKNAVVIDYKTGGIDENNLSKLYREIYQGLKIQLPIYLTALKAAGYNPAGAFYVPIKDSYRQSGVAYKAYGLANEGQIAEEDFNLGFKKGSVSAERIDAVKNYCNEILPLALKEILFEPPKKSPIETCGNCTYKPICGGEGEKNARAEAKVDEGHFN